MRFHVVSLPHTQTTREYSWCAYTQKVRRFCDMMSSLDHEVFLYSGTENEASCTEHVTASPAPMVGIPPFETTHPAFAIMNANAIIQIRERAQPDDFLCLIGGLVQKPIADALPRLMPVEFGVGYGGVFSAYRVFESYAWMHTIYGALYGSHTADGKFYDAVIPNYFDPAEFPRGDGAGDADGKYLLYLGRVIERKGVEIAVETARRLDARLVIAGDGEVPTTYGERLGPVGPDKRTELLQHATATFTPTIYVEPFCGAHVESMLVGTPVITTDWGVFTETVESGKTGYRCRTLGEFMWAARHAHELDRDYIRHQALERWSADVVRWQYEDYFTRLQTLRGAGWYDTTERPPNR